METIKRSIERYKWIRKLSECLHGTWTKNCPVHDFIDEDRTIGEISERLQSDDCVCDNIAIGLKVLVAQVLDRTQPEPVNASMIEEAIQKMSSPKENK